MKRLSHSFFFFLIILTTFPACKKDKPEQPVQHPDDISGSRIWIANEGSLGNGNASLSILFPEKDSMFNHVFQTENNQPLGDVFESMTKVGDEVFLAINNSDQIKVIDGDNYTLKGLISVQKPRYMLLLDSTKMYVTSLFYPKINIVNPKTFQTTGQITTDYPNTEGLLSFEGNVYVCNWDTACSYIYEINPETNQITHRIPISGYAPKQVLADKNGKLWVLAGNIEKNKPATLTCLDPHSRMIIKSYHFPANAEVMKACWNQGKDTLYFLGVNYNGNNAYNGVFRMSIVADSVPATPFIAAQPLQYFWALGVDTASGLIYVGDPKGFIQQGTVLVYNAAGAKLHSYSVGVGPGFFLF